MKPNIPLLLSVCTCSLYALNPPANRPATPICGLREAIAIAETEVQKIDASYYCSQGGYQYAYMEPRSGQLPNDHWILRFVRSGSGPKEDGTGYDDLEVRVSLDGKRSMVEKT